MATAYEVNAVLSGNPAHGESLATGETAYLHDRYAEERVKRLRARGGDKYIDFSATDSPETLLDDLYVDLGKVKDVQTVFPNQRCHVLVVGTGLGGILAAVRMIQVGVPASDIRLVDTAGGFGGTWYWNRYPGLKCDIESYSYLPLLQETGYMPKHRYSYGPEIRAYANQIAEHFGFSDNAAFCTKAERMVWDNAGKEWQVNLLQTRKGHFPARITVRAPFVFTSNGSFNMPKLPSIPGLLDYKGDMFHSSRWDYSITGGSDVLPSLEKLKSKRVAVIGTGCSAVQIVGPLAKWAEHLYVVQRTPASVDERRQTATDTRDFQQTIAKGENWQRERIRNFHGFFTTGELPKRNLVNDAWTDFTCMCVLAGHTSSPTRPEDLPAYISRLAELDDPHTSRIRARVDSQVKNPALAEKLKAWYPTWCKRPAFHDDYYPVFSRENVTLIDTQGKNLDCITSDSLVCEGRNYPVDLIIFATGFAAPFEGSPADKAKCPIIGRGGVSMSDQWAEHGPSTLHGVLDRNFPNLFLAGPWQAAASPSYLFAVDQLAIHAASIYASAEKQADGRPFSVAPSATAAEQWAEEIVRRSLGAAAMTGCTPSYFNLEGAVEKMSPEKKQKLSRSGVWGQGIESYLELIETWRAEGSMEGIEVSIG